MTFADTSTPVVVVNCRLAGLALMRSLGPLGVPMYGVDVDPRAPAMRSRYCRNSHAVEFSDDHPEPLVDRLLAIGRWLGRRAILMATSDETTQIVADHAEVLREYYLFQDNSPALVRQLASKREMFGLAVAHGVPTPDTRFPQSLDDLLEYAAQASFPVMLKGVYGNRLELRTRKKMALVHSRQELVAAYEAMEDPDAPNLMLQEYIPGGDDQVYIFNGYFNARSECLFGLTGFKVRQFPVHVGCASLGECRWIDELAATTTRFMREVGYRGILDIGYRLDPRDGRYKVLDINPRIGQAFRLFAAPNGHDVARALYLDFTGQPQPAVERRDGRRWFIEDYDLISSYHYRREGTLSLGQWVRSFRGVEESAWFDHRDPVPFAIMLRGLTTRGALAVANRAKDQVKRVVRRLVPLALRKRTALAVHRQKWIRAERREWWALELVRDFAAADPDGFHRFLWSHHLAYAATYDTSRFGAENMKASRQMFFADLRQQLATNGADVTREIRTVFEVGCSLGYQLRYMETELFPHATELAGIDIDRHAIAAGQAWLRGADSRVTLRHEDIGRLDEVLRGKSYDLIVCTGVLMYLQEAQAAQAVRTMLQHARFVALAGLAHPIIDNARLVQSDVRVTDTTFIHNLDAMVGSGGGSVTARRWEGSRDVDGNTIYFVFGSGVEGEQQALCEALSA